IDGNTFTNNGWAAISLTNEQPIVWMRFWQDVTATVRDSIVWQASFVDLDEDELWFTHDNLEVVLTLDGEQVPVEIWDVYFDDGLGEFRFDMEYWAGPLPLGEHEFEVHFIIAGEEYESGWFGHVTVNENAVVPVRFYEDATITEGDQIQWQETWSNTDLATLEEWVAGIEVFLSINGEEVEVSYSGIYFDDSRERYPDEDRYRFDATFITDPLDVGEYVFDRVTFEFGTVHTSSSLITVLPVSVDDNNVVSNNFIGNNGQAMWMDNSNSNFIVGNTIESNWGEAISTWQSNRNVFTDNVIQTNNGWGLNTGGSDNFVSNNIVRWNPMGISIHDGSNNVLSNNDVYQNWDGSGIDISGSTDTFLTENFIYENGMGIAIFDSHNTQVHFNEIFDNFGDGVMINNAPLTSITDNVIYGNWGAGVFSFTDNTAYMRFWQDITATDLQNIFWQVTSSWHDFDELQYEHDNMIVILTVDGEQVEVEFSDIWFDEGEGIFRYDINYFSSPLPVGEHEFEVYSTLDGQEVFAANVIVTVIPGEPSLGEYIITGNYLANNGWVGIGMENVEGGLVDSNTIENNGGQGIWIGQSSQIEVTNNVLWSNWADSGINLWTISDSFVSGNEIMYHQGPAILLEFSSGNVIENNQLHDNAGGISLTVSDGNIIQFNDVFWNWGDGINIHNSHDNLVFDNVIHENGGAGVWSFSAFDAFFGFWEDIVVTDKHNIHWGGESMSDDPDYLQYEHDYLIADLTINGEPVEVGFSDIWFDEGDGMFKYEIFYDSGPLPVGEYDFEIHFVLDGEELFTAVTHVTVIPGETSASNNDFKNNYVAYNGWMGIGLDHAVEDSVDTNTIEGNGDNGVFLQASTMVEITNNVIQSNGNGVLLVESSNNLISSNEIFDGYGAGIGILFNSNENVITHNVVHDLGDDGIGGWDSHGNLIFYNEIYNVDDGIIFRFSNENVIAKNYIHDNRNRGIFLTTEPFDPVQFRFFEDVTVTDVESLFWQATSVSDNFDYLQFERDNIIVELSVNGDLVEVEITDIWFDDEDGLFKYDLNYFSSPLPVGEHFFDVRFVFEGDIELGYEPFEFEITAVVTVIPNESSSSGNQIFKNKITDNANTAVRLFGSDNNYISKNKIARNGMGGIALIRSDDNIIEHNWSYENGRSGIFLRTALRNLIHCNWLFNNGYAGITLFDGSSGNFVFRNRILTNPRGISSEISDGNIYMLNKIKDNEIGLYLTQSHSSFIFANAISKNIVGVFLEASNNNHISHNFIRSNEYGLGLFYSNENIIERNRFWKNGVAVYISESYDNVFIRNWFYRNGIDFEISE
ncbi:MAG: right-handed parallel beta-helix repeat-containing protein, partial [Candidatus Kariarchaeaceae archaeon]